MRTGILAAGVLLAAMLTPGCERAPVIVEDRLDVLGTFAEITIVLPDAERARSIAGTVEQELRRLDQVGYTFADRGELHDLNAALARGETRAVSGELLALIRLAGELSEASGGLFNPAAGELTALWEFRCDRPDCTESPYPDEVRNLIDQKDAAVIASRPSMRDLMIEGNEVGSGNPSVRLEFGDMIRGYALDRAVERLKALGVTDAMVDIGGSIRSLGRRGTRPWWAAVLDVTGKASIGYIEMGEGESVVTVRAFDRSIGGEDFVYRHVVDPRTGLPVCDVMAVTVIHDSAARANAAAAALLVAGVDGWAEVARGMGIGPVLMILDDGSIYTSTAMAERVHWNRKLRHGHLVP